MSHVRRLRRRKSEREKERDDDDRDGDLNTTSMIPWIVILTLFVRNVKTLLTAERESERNRASSCIAGYFKTMPSDILGWTSGVRDAVEVIQRKRNTDAVRRLKKLVEDAYVYYEGDADATRPSWHTKYLASANDDMSRKFKTALIDLRRVLSTLDVDDGEDDDEFVASPRAVESLLLTILRSLTEDAGDERRTMSEEDAARRRKRRHDMIVALRRQRCAAEIYESVCTISDMVTRLSRTSRSRHSSSQLDDMWSTTAASSTTLASACCQHERLSCDIDALQSALTSRFMSIFLENTIRDVLEPANVDPCVLRATVSSSTAFSASETQIVSDALLSTASHRITSLERQECERKRATLHHRRTRIRRDARQRHRTTDEEPPRPPAENSPPR